MTKLPSAYKCYATDTKGISNFISFTPAEHLAKIDFQGQSQRLDTAGVKEEPPATKPKLKPARDPRSHRTELDFQSLLFF